MVQSKSIFQLFLHNEIFQLDALSDRQSVQ